MWRIFFLLLFLTASVRASSPGEAVTAAYNHLQKVPEQDQQYLRYLLIPPMDLKERDTFLKVFAFQVNSLSRKARLKKPADLLISPDLICLNYTWFKWNPEVYDKLANEDPYFHTLVLAEEEKVELKPWPGGVWDEPGPDKGKYFAPGAFPIKEKVKNLSRKTLAATAPWLDPAKMSYLVEKTQSKAPILRADWFLLQTGIQKNRVAGYYQFLELKNRNDFEKLTGLKIKEAKELEREIASIVNKSGVSIRNRQIYRFGAIDAGYWQTRDVLKKQTKEQNALNSLNGDFKHDAEEHYGYLSNRLFAYYLSDQNGVQQDTAPDEVGGDSSSTNNDTKIHIFKSCVTCHKEGLRPIKDYGRQQLFRGNNILASYDKEKFERLEQLYLLPLQKWYDRDVRDFTEALAELNGIDWTPTKNSNEYSKFWKKWSEDDVSLEQAALEIGDGQTAKGLQAAIRRYATPKNKGGLGKLVPNALLAYTTDPPGELLREHYEELYSKLQEISRGVTTP